MNRLAAHAICSLSLILATGCPVQQELANPPVPTGPAVEKTEGYVEPTPAPAEFQVEFDTSAGKIVVDVHRDWAPKGADRFYNLIQEGFYDGCRFFRVVPGFVVQFGMHGDPAVQSKWHFARIPDDPVKQPNRRGTITFATSGPDSRTSQLFINLGDNQNLDAMGFAPFGEITEGMDVVDAITAEYGERPDQGQILSRGNAYLKENFPSLDYIKTAKVVGEPAGEAATDGAAQPDSDPASAGVQKSDASSN